LRKKFLTAIPWRFVPPFLRVHPLIGDLPGLEKSVQWITRRQTDGRPNPRHRQGIVDSTD
jgi:hypothetical protein